MAASWCGRVRAVLARGPYLSAMKVECTTTASTKMQQDRSVKDPWFKPLLLATITYYIPLLRLRFHLSVCPSVCDMLELCINERTFHRIYLHHLIGNGPNSVVEQNCEKLFPQGSWLCRRGYEQVALLLQRDHAVLPACQ